MHNYPFRDLSGPCLQNNHHNIVVVNDQGRELSIQRRDTCLQTGLYGMKDNAGVILLIQLLVNAKIANIFARIIHSHSDFVLNIN